MFLFITAQWFMEFTISFQIFSTRHCSVSEQRPSNSLSSGRYVCKCFRLKWFLSLCFFFPKASLAKKCFPQHWPVWLHFLSLSSPIPGAIKVQPNGPGSVVVSPNNCHWWTGLAASGLGLTRHPGSAPSTIDCNIHKKMLNCCNTSVEWNRL